jgi:hypothetical protein
VRKKSEIFERKFKTQNPDELQLAKMKSLKGILTAPDKKLRLDTLNKCEDVLHKLYEKVEGPPVSSTTVSVSGMFYKQWLLIRNGKEDWLTLKKAIKLKYGFCKKSLQKDATLTSSHLVHTGTLL